jgi:tRNA-(ms[2]io[6]A)-hydroxylase
MLGLKLETDPIWVKNIVEGNLEEIMTDHAYCEQKAATNAITLIVSFPELSELVNAMSDLVQEEMGHFRMVHDRMLAQGLTLGRERKDDYVNELRKFMRKGLSRELHLLDRLLFAAMIEARSCERFKVLSEHLSDRDLADFYRDLMASEARHYTTFLKLAKKYVPADQVEARWEEWLEYEAQVIRNYGKQERIHG